MTISKDDIEAEWEMWGPDKPWHCTQCDSLLSIKDVPECDGTDPFIPESEWKKHIAEKATGPLSFEQFSEIMIRWWKRVEPTPDKAKYLQYKEPELTTSSEKFKELKISKELKEILEEQLNTSTFDHEEEVDSE